MLCGAEPTTFGAGTITRIRDACLPLEPYLRTKRLEENDWRKTEGCRKSVPRQCGDHPSRTSVTRVSGILRAAPERNPTPSPIDARSCVTPPDEHQSQLTPAFVSRRDNGVHGETLNSSVPCKPR